MIFILALIFLFLAVPFFRTDSRILTSGLIAALSASVLIFTFFSKARKIRLSFKEKNFFLISSFIYILYFIILLYFDFKNFYLADYDYTSIAEVLLETSRGRFFRVHHIGDMDRANFLAHHFSPGLILAVPFTLIGHRIFYGISLISFTALSLFIYSRILKFFPFYQRKILFLFFLTNLFTFRLHSSYHFEIMILSFFLIFLHGYLSKNRMTEVSGYILCILMKEDMAVYFSLLSFYFLFKKEYRRFLLILSSSFLHFFLAVPFFQSFADPSARENWLHAYSYLGSSPGQAALSILKNPSVIAERFNFKVWKQFGAGFGFSPFISPLYWISVLPVQILHFLSDRKWHSEIYNYYCYTLIGNFLFSFLKSISEINSVLKNRKRKLLLACCIFIVSFYQSSRDSDFPRKFRMEKTEPERYTNIISLTALIPPGKELSAGFDLGSFILNSNPVYPLKIHSLKEYVLIDEKSFSPYLDQGTVFRQLDNPENQYVIIQKKGSASLYRNCPVKDKDCRQGREHSN